MAVGASEGWLQGWLSRLIPKPDNYVLSDQPKGQQKGPQATDAQAQQCVNLRIKALSAPQIPVAHRNYHFQECSLTAFRDSTRTQGEPTAKARSQHRIERAMPSKLTKRRACFWCLDRRHLLWSCEELSEVTGADKKMMFEEIARSATTKQKRFFFIKNLLPILEKYSLHLPEHLSLAEDLANDEQHQQQEQQQQQSIAVTTESSHSMCIDPAWMPSEAIDCQHYQHSEGDLEAGGSQYACSGVDWTPNELLWGGIDWAPDRLIDGSIDWTPGELLWGNWVSGPYPATSHSESALHIPIPPLCAESVNELSMFGTRCIDSLVPYNLKMFHCEDAHGRFWVQGLGSQQPLDLHQHMQAVRALLSQPDAPLGDSPRMALVLEHAAVEDVPQNVDMVWLRHHVLKLASAYCSSRDAQACQTAAATATSHLTGAESAAGNEAPPSRFNPTVPAIHQGARSWASVVASNIPQENHRHAMAQKEDDDIQRAIKVSMGTAHHPNRAAGNRHKADAMSAPTGPQPHAELPKPPIATGTQHLPVNVTAPTSKRPLPKDLPLPPKPVLLPVKEKARVKAIRAGRCSRATGLPAAASRAEESGSLGASATHAPGAEAGNTEQRRSWASPLPQDTQGIVSDPRREQEELDIQAAIQASLLSTGAPPQSGRQAADGAEVEPASQAAGLQNNIGEYNCFLNVILQCLWRCHDFRVAFMEQDPSCLQDHPVVAALLQLFGALSDQEAYQQQLLAGRLQAQAAKRKCVVLDPSVLREALANVEEGRPFRLGEMNDAAEVLTALYDAMGRMAGGAQLVDTYFGQRIQESGVPSLATLLRLTEHQGQKSCDKDAHGCGRLCDPQHKLLGDAPPVFVLQLVWEGPQEQVQNIVDTMSCIQEDLDLSELYVGSGGAGRKYQLRSMVGFYGSHYHALVCDHKQWWTLDDSHVRSLGTWSDVLLTCQQGHVQPSVLFFESV
ncbi:hypothetical protein WJX73_009686 [Symbiochloris irregularis]|uniref:USP domain-containing protein n=1 Tax=Symbiochloris irregularis TaxID=706552 RepID=A0AAW1P150_9CHLO